MASAEDGSTTLTPEALAMAFAQLQTELAGFKAETAIKVASRERSHTSELQLALGDLLAGEAQLP